MGGLTAWHTREGDEMSRVRHQPGDKVRDTIYPRRGEVVQQVTGAGSSPDTLVRWADGTSDWCTSGTEIEADEEGK